jgi:hypothetical protein
MALQFRISNAAAKALADALTGQIDAGTAALLRIYSGTIPANVDDGVGAGTLLAELTFSGTSFGAATDANPGGLITANAITQDSSADNTGTAAWFAIITQNAGTLVAMGSVGTSGCDLNLNTVAITAGSAVAVTAFTITMPEA